MNQYVTGAVINDKDCCYDHSSERRELEKTAKMLFG